MCVGKQQRNSHGKIVTCSCFFFFLQHNTTDELARLFEIRDNEVYNILALGGHAQSAGDVGFLRQIYYENPFDSILEQFLKKKKNGDFF